MKANEIGKSSQNNTTTDHRHTCTLHVLDLRAENFCLLDFHVEVHEKLGANFKHPLSSCPLSIHPATVMIQNIISFFSQWRKKVVNFKIVFSLSDNNTYIRLLTN